MSRGEHTQGMKKTMMYLPEEMHRYLADQADHRGISMAEVVREAITHYRTANEQEPVVTLDALFESVQDTDPADDLALHIDEVLTDHYASGSWESLGRAQGTE